MEKSRGNKILSIIAIAIAVVSLSIGYAAFSATLTINGTGTVKASNWQVRFENLSLVTKTGTATEETAPTINTNDTNIGDYSVTLTTPGDSISYNFDVANNGTFDAEVTAITIPTPTCTGNGANAETDATNVCANLSYTLTYEDGSEIKVGDAINATEKKAMVLTLTYSNAVTADILPTDDVAISDLGITILYSQK